MDQEELDVCECAGCGAEIDLHADRYFAFFDQGVLCFECAIERGGQYDENGDAWPVSPDLASFGDEQRSQA